LVHAANRSPGDVQAVAADVALRARMSPGRPAFWFTVAALIVAVLVWVALHRKLGCCLPLCDQCGGLEDRGELGCLAGRKSCPQAAIAIAHCDRDLPLVVDDNPEFNLVVTMGSADRDVMRISGHGR
jgi:hypothetical protein